MNFADLYRASNSLVGPNIPFRELVKVVIAYHPRVGDVELIPCDLDETISLGHMTYEEGRSSPYGEPYDVAIIRYSRTLNRCWRRAVCTKELMHVFDDSAAQTSDHEKFMKLMRELGTNTLLPGDASPMLLSERNTEWMALLALCPQRLRDELAPHYANGSMNDLAVAERLKIPQVMIRALMSDYYWRALERLTGETPAPVSKKGHPA